MSKRKGHITTMLFAHEGETDVRSFTFTDHKGTRLGTLSVVASAFGQSLDVSTPDVAVLRSIAAEATALADKLAAEGKE